MYASEKEIEDIVANFCKKNNCSSKIFEVSKIAKVATGGKNGKLSNRTKVFSDECTYVIKYYQQLDLVIIWNYAQNHSMSYNYNTIKEKLSNGVRYGDKGKEFHDREQCLVYFDKGKNLYQLLRLIANPI